MNAEHTLDIALLILRLGIGLTLFAHGAQKLFGWFGGAGLAATGQGLDSIGFRPGKLNAFFAGLGEAGGGLLLTLGLFTPLAGAAAAATMLVAASTHLPAGFFNGKGGFEFPMTLGIAAITLVVGGPGQYSLDDTMDYPLDDPWVGIIALIVAAVLALGLIGRRRAYTKANAPS